MTVKEAAKALGIKEARVRQLCRAGAFGYKVGRDWLIYPHEVEHYKATRPPRGRPRKEK